MSEAADLIDQIALATAGPRKLQAAAGPLVLTYVRDLTPADIEVLHSTPVESTYTPLKALRATHHALARLIAKGYKYHECAAATGHSPSRISNLMTLDRAFIDLVRHYQDEEARVSIDTSGRLAMLGIAAIEELQERLEEKPEQFSNKNLLELAEMTFDRSIAPAKGSSARTGISGAANGGVNVNVTFVSPAAGTPEAPSSAPLPAHLQLSAEIEDAMEVIVERKQSG